ncbi:MAG TPA: Minf_1886 family protein, partial [Planctomycetota bacterium]|nr:Minf_1886 family protein [Planctomycetota bacterium]
LVAQELVEGMLDLATIRFGLMAELVLREWGLKSAEDVGRITFALIDVGVFSKQPSDRLEDFAGGPDFGGVLTKRSRQRLCPTVA